MPGRRLYYNDGNPDSIPGKGVKPQDNKHNEELWLEALQLLEAQESEPAGDTVALESFQARSEDHRQALRKAERYLEVSRKMPRKERSVWWSIRLQAQLWVARFGQAPVASAVVVLLAFGVAWALLRSPPADLTPPVQEIAQDVFEQSYRTAWQQRKEVALPDGSRLWLDWRSEVDAQIDGAARTVTVNAGTVAFDVATDADSPFIVRANEVQVRVTGTEFTVAMDRGDRVAVDVMEGSVSVRLGADRSALTAAERVVAEEGRLRPVERRQTEEMGRWREGILVFDKRPLLESIEALSAYLPYQVDTRSLAYSGRRVTGVYLIDQAERGLTAIIQSHGLEARPRGNTLELRERRPVRP